MGFAHENQAAGSADSSPLGGAAEALAGQSGSRMAFVRKVYLTVAGGLAAAGVAGTAAAAFPVALAPFRVIFGVASFALLIAALFCRANSAINKPLFWVVNVSCGLSLGSLYPLLLAEDLGYVMFLAIGTAVAVFGGLTAYVFATRQDFSWMGGMLYTSLIGMVLLSLCNMFFGLGMFPSLLHGGAGVLLFSGFILYDTSNILHRYDDDQHYAAALELCLDFFNLVRYLIEIFVSLAGDD